VHLHEAAELLVSSTETIRKRLLRGTIHSCKYQDGRVLVWLDERGTTVTFKEKSNLSRSRETSCTTGHGPSRKPTAK
jgi:hypothetical protein